MSDPSPSQRDAVGSRWTATSGRGVERGQQQTALGDRRPPCSVWLSGRAGLFWFAALFCVAVCAPGLFSAQIAAPVSTPTRWVGTWATSPRPEDKPDPSIELADATLRQVVHVSLGGRTVRLRVSNAFGTTPLVLYGVHLARAVTPIGSGAIQPGSDREFRFNGARAVTVPPGAVMLSDPVELGFPPLADLAISMHLKSVPVTLTGHPGSRTNSYVVSGDRLSDAEMATAKKTVHWYFITGLDVVDADGTAAAVVVLGDSITDGYGCTTDANNRWTDELARRLQANPRTQRVGVLNHGIGGNRLLRDGLGPNALARFDRDVICQTGVRWLVILEGINDLGTRKDALAKGESFATAADVIAAYSQMIERAHTHGIRVIGATILPFEGSKNYWTADGDEDRRTINTWIRTSGRFDAVIDFEAALRDRENPNRLAAAYDNDHLHPSLAGYVAMAHAVDLALFLAPAESGKPVKR